MCDPYHAYLPHTPTPPPVQYEALAAKHQGAKARVRTLEAESQQHKQQVKMVISKTETDDKLIQVRACTGSVVCSVVCVAWPLCV
jgi:hypothetical protein